MKLLASLVVAASVGMAASLMGQAPGGGLPRAADGKPNFNGVWQTLNAAHWDLEAHGGALGVRPGPSVVVGGSIPYRPEMLKERQRNFAERDKMDLAEFACFMPGVPRAMYMPHPFEIIQSPQIILMNFEFGHTRRNIMMTGSHPEGFPNTWMGDSRGRWEGDTLVVDTTNLDERTWLDRSGNFHSGALRVVERYTMTDPTHIQYEATLDDPKVYTKPWSIRMMLYKIVEPNPQILEYECIYYLQEKKYGNVKPIGVP